MAETVAPTPQDLYQEDKAAFLKKFDGSHLDESHLRQIGLGTRIPRAPVAKLMIQFDPRLTMESIYRNVKARKPHPSAAKNYKPRTASV